MRRRTGEEGTESQLAAQPPAKEHSTVQPPAAGNVVAQRRPVDLPEVGGRAPSSMMARTKAAAASLIGAQKHLAATELRMRTLEGAFPLAEPARRLPTAQMAEQFQCVGFSALGQARNLPARPPKLVASVRGAR